MVYINKGDHENSHGLPKCDSVGLQDNVQHEYAHIDVPAQMPEEVEKLEYICHTLNVICAQQQLHTHFSVAPNMMHMGTN